jgi:hypothetical protein
MRGTRWTEPKLKTDERLTSYIPRFCAFLLGESDRIADPGKPEISIPQLCTFMEALIDQMPKANRKGRYEQIRAKVRDVVMMCFSVAVANREQLELLATMLDRGHILRTVHDGWAETIRAKQKQDFRDTVALLVEIYCLAYLNSPSGNPKNRPKGSASRETAVFDTTVIHRTLEAVTSAGENREGPAEGYSLADAETELRNQLRLALTEFSAPSRGDGTEKSKFDTHFKRVLRKLRTMHELADKNSN